MKRNKPAVRNNKKKQLMKNGAVMNSLGVSAHVNNDFRRLSVDQENTKVLIFWLELQCLYILLKFFSTMTH